MGHIRHMTIDENKGERREDKTDALCRRRGSRLGGGKKIA